MTDLIHNLPSDDQEIDQNDLKLLQTVLKTKTYNIGTFMASMRPHLMYGILFLLFISLDINSLIMASFPYTRKSEWSVRLFKTFIFICSTFVITSYIDL